MAFTNKEFPGRVFRTFEEYEEACKLRASIEKDLEERTSEPLARVTAKVLPASRDVIERKLIALEQKVESLFQSLPRKKIDPAPGENLEGILMGTVLRGESRGSQYTLEVLADKYLCSNGYLYQSLSGAALGVSGNRRSGWKFWHGSDGRPIGEIVGRFYANDDTFEESV